MAWLGSGDHVIAETLQIRVTYSTNQGQGAIRAQTAVEDHVWDHGPVVTRFQIDICASSCH